MQLQGSRMAVASAPSRVRSVQCKALFGSSTKQATSDFYNFKVKVRASLLAVHPKQQCGKPLPLLLIWK